LDAPINIREARSDELPLAAAHYLGMRREVGWNDDELEPGWEERFATVYADGAARGELRYFIAELGDAVVGSAVALRKRSLSSEYVRDAAPGYLANVYVEQPYRRRGAAHALTAAAIDWLRSIGCRVVRLQASSAGRKLYESFGFAPSGEMELEL
jgi:GNAT superfamily N-acetyltransferase